MKIKIGNLLMKYEPAIATSRNCTLLLIKVNLFRIANKLNEARKKGKAEDLYKLWEKIGGNTNKLKTAIDQGLKVEFKHHPNAHKFEGFDYYYFPDNVVVPAVAAPAVGAVPVVTKLASFLGKLGISTKDVTNGIGKLAKTGAEQLLKEKGVKPVMNADGTYSATLPSDAVKLKSDFTITPTIAIAGALALFVGIKMLRK